MNDLVVIAAADPNKSLSGGFGLLVFLVLVVIVVFLFRSMNRHLRKVRQINFDDDKEKAASDPNAAPKVASTSNTASTPNAASNPELDSASEPTAKPHGPSAVK